MRATSRHCLEPPTKINLYVGKQCVQYNLPQAEADEHLVALIKARGTWVEPPVGA